MSQNAVLAEVVGGAVLGFVEKSLPNLPTVPVIGRAGTIALACHVLGKGHPNVARIGNAAATPAGYQLASQGRVAGEDEGEPGAW